MSRKTEGKVSRRVELEKRQNQRLEKRGDPSISALSSPIALEIRPKVGQSERVEDAAVFNKDCRLKLSGELQLEAASISEALELTCQGKFEEAIGMLKDIARSSPLSDWRLFVRGLHAFYLGDLETARQNWTRLDRTRRPARIASTLLLTETELLTKTDQPLEVEIAPVSKSLVEHAKTLRLRKNAVAAAEAIAKVRHRDPDTTFSVSQVAMLSNFFNAYRKLDHEFVSSVGRACIGLAVQQGNMEVFDRLAKMVPGAVDDPKWNRTRMLYAIAFEGAHDVVEKAATAYLLQDLPKITQLPKQVREALACKIYLVQAEMLSTLNDRSIFSFSYGETRGDFNKIDALLRKAIQAYPTYRIAHQKLISSMESQLKRRLSKSEEEKLEKRIIAAKEELVRVIPDEVQTTLELIDFYLDEDQLEKANALVKQLGGQRLEDPLSKALPWKLKLREAMRLSRRKADLALAHKALDEAESLWPVWLNRNWLPFLRAALVLRNGDQARFAELTAAARKEQKISDFVGEVMTFAALQQMNIPSSDLKPFRTSVESQAENANKIELADLFSVGSFFWDLVRTGLKHKGYRLQASKLGRAFADQMKFHDNSNLNATQIDAVSWGAHHRFWPLGNDYTPTPSIKKLAMSEPKIAAVVLAWVQALEHFPRYRMIEYEPLIKLAKEAARTEKDAFYRYLFDKVADGANNIISEAKAEEEQRKLYGSRSNYDYEFDDDELDDELDDEDDEDDECDCANCRAKRARMRGAFLEEDVDQEDEDALANELFAKAPIVGKVFSKLGPNGTNELHSILNSNQLQDSPEELVKALGKLFPRYGMSMMDAMEFLMELRKASGSIPSAYFANGKGNPSDLGSASPATVTPAAMTPATLTPEELKEARKRREKELEKRKRETNKGGSRP